MWWFKVILTAFLPEALVQNFSNMTSFTAQGPQSCLHPEPWSPCAVSSRGGMGALGGAMWTPQGWLQS